MYIKNQSARNCVKSVSQRLGLGTEKWHLKLVNLSFSEKQRHSSLKRMFVL